MAVRERPLFLACLLALLAAAAIMPSPTLAAPGDLLWTQTYNSGGTQYDTGNDVTVDSGGNIYITGYQATNGNDMFLRKYDSAGNFQWIQTYNSGGTQADYGNDVAVDSGGNIYVTGRENSIWDTIFLLKYDPAGNFQWIQKYILGTFGDGQGVTVDFGGNIYITGYQGTNGNDMFLRKYDSTGAFQWMQTYNSGGTQADYGTNVAMDSGGNIYVAGYQATGGLDMFLRKYDSAGNFQWMQTYNSGGSQSDSGRSLAVDSANNIYITGLQGTNGTDMLLRKYDSSGNFQWMQTYTSAGSDIDRGEAVAVDNASNIYVVGYQAETTTDIFLRKYDSAGSFQWMQTYDSGGGAPTDYGFGVAVDSNNNLDVVGYQSTNGGDAVLLQYDGGVDCGLRVYDGTSTVTLDCETPASTTSLRIYNNGATSGIKLVDPADPNASRLRIGVPDGAGGTVIKALRKQ